MRPSIRVHGRRLAIKPAVINSNVLAILRQCPAPTKWVGGLLTFDATPESIAWVTRYFKDSSWTDDAQMIAERILNIQRNALPSPTAPRVRDYVPKTKNWEHQDKLFALQKDREFFAYFMEQGTGKSKSALDTAAYNYAQGRIRGLLIIAYPNGVHRKWITKDVPEHLPDWCKPLCAVWNASQGPKRLQALLADRAVQGLRILSMNVEALSTKKGLEAAKQFLLAFPSMAVIDESTSMKTPKAARTKNILKLKPFAPYRRILTGTPATKGPLGLYTQFDFLDEDIFGFSSFYTFRAHYAVMVTLPGLCDKRGHPIQVVKGFQNLEELQERIAPHSFRVLKSECLDLPPKLYELVNYDLNDEQKRHYENFKSESMTEFRGQRITAPLKMTILLRAHQIACGFLPLKDPEHELGAPITEDNPRLEALMNQLELIDGKAIIVATYRYSLREIYTALVAKYGKDAVGAFAGGMKEKDQDTVKARFQNMKDPMRFLVCQIRAAAYGHDFTAASYVYFYCNHFSLELRQQMEDRVHRGGLNHSVTYFDFEAEGTVDTKIIETLRSNKEIASLITGDPLEAWI